MTKDRYTCK